MNWLLFLSIHPSVSHQSLELRWANIRAPIAKQWFTISVYGVSSLRVCKVCPDPATNVEGKYEIHITADIAFAFQQYLFATNQSWPEVEAVMSNINNDKEKRREEREEKRREEKRREEKRREEKRREEKRREEKRKEEKKRRE